MQIVPDCGYHAYNNEKGKNEDKEGSIELQKMGKQEKDNDVPVLLVTHVNNN